jgi:outer membrane biosynthesis protein TonB
MATMAGARRSPVGLIGSALLHVGIIGATLFTFAHKLDITEESAPVVPVDLVTVAAKTNITPMVKVRPKIEPREDEQPTPPEPQKTEASPEPTPQPEKMDAPPEPKPVETSPSQQAIAPEPVKTPPPPPRVTRKPEPKAAAEPRKEKFDIDKVMALIDKRTPTEKSPPNARVGERNIKGFGAENAMTADLADALRGQIQQCWNPPVGSPHPEELVVDFEVFLNQDGSIAQTPQLSGDSASTASHDSFTRAAAEAARRAIYTCAPYKLPGDRFSQWHDITLTFDPRQMLGQ